MRNLPRAAASGTASRRTAPPGGGRSSPAGPLLLFLAGAAVFLAGFHSIIDADIWFHLRAGSQIAAGSIPRTDTFSYPSAGRPYLDLHWLFQWLAYGIYRAAGEPGLIWMVSLLVTATFALLYRLARRETAMPLAAGLTALGGILASERFEPRPEIFTFFFFVLVSWLARRHSEGARRAWWAIPLVILLWVNTEGLFILGYAVLAAALLDRPRDRRLWAALGLSLAASLVNPYFLKGALHPFVLFTRINRSLPIYSATIGEFLSPFSGPALHPSVAIFPFYLGLIGAALLACGRWPRRGEILLMAVFVYLSLSARRNLALLALAATPILARWLERGRQRAGVRSLWRRLPLSGQRALSAGAAGLAIVALLFYIDGLLTNRIYSHAETNRQTGTGPAPVSFAREAARFLRGNGVKGPVFTTFSAGSYFAWALPEEKEFIDGRLEVHTAQHYQEYLRMLNGGEAWAAAERRYGFNAAVIQYMDAPTLVVERLRDPTWAAVHLDDTAIVLLKRNERNDAVIQKESLTASRLQAEFPSMSAARIDSALALPPAPSRFSLTRLFTSERFPWSAIDLGQFFTMINRWEYALPQFLAASREAPALAAPRLMTAVCLTQLNRPRAALAALDVAEGIGGSKGVRARLYSARGDVLLALGRAGAAVDSYTRCLQNTPSTSPQIANTLASRAYARLKAGAPEPALDDIRESLRRQPGSAGSYWILGLIEEARGQAGAARQAYERFKAMGGHSAEVDAALERLAGRG